MPRLLEDPKLKEVAQLHGKSVGQLVLRYLVIDTGFVLAMQPF
jgi:diketogulonate reductase-like aldo/keto reductase